MKCDSCGKKKAVVHIKQVMGKELLEFHLCENCAYEKGISTQEDKLDLSLSNLLAGLLETSSSSKKEKHYNCPRCGITFQEVRKEGRLGCSECYSAFQKDIKLLLSSLTGYKRHRGKFPARLKAVKGYLIDREVLKDRLKKAVRSEDYEEAARLRDKIQEYERDVEQKI